MDDIRHVKALLKAGTVDVNVVGRDGWTAFHVAVFLDRVNIAKYLIKNGADIDAIFFVGDSHFRAIHVLCYQGLNRDEQGGNIICRGGKLLEVLLKTSVDVNAVDSSGRTAIEYCSYYGRRRHLHMLLKAGASALANDCKSLDYAISRGHWNCARCLVEKGKDLLVKKIESLKIRDLLRKVVTIVAQNGFTDCYLSILTAFRKVDVNADKLPWQAISRTRNVLPSCV